MGGVHSDDREPFTYSEPLAHPTASSPLVMLEGRQIGEQSDYFHISEC